MSNLIINILKIMKPIFKLITMYMGLVILIDLDRLNIYIQFFCITNVILYKMLDLNDFLLHLLYIYKNLI